MKPSSLFACSVFCCVVLICHPLAAQIADDANTAKLQQRDQVWQQAVQDANEGKLDEAATLFEQVYSIEESVFGPTHPELLGTLDVLAKVAELKQDTRAVIDIRKRQHRVTESRFGNTDYRTLDAKRAITNAEQDVNRSPEARAQLKKATELSTEAVALYQSGQYQSAVAIAKQAMDISKSVLGEQHPSYATCLNNLAVLYFSMGDYPRAEPLYVQAMEIRKAVLGEQHPKYAASLGTLALLYDSMGDYPRAEPLYVQAMEIHKAVLGEQHPDYATNLNNLARLYSSMGDYARAEPLLVQAMKIFKVVLGEQHPHYAGSLLNLAALYQSMRDYPRAVPLYAQAMEIEKAVLGEQHPKYAKGLNNLASLYFSMCDYSRAEPLYVQAMEIRKAVLGEQHPDYAISLNNLAVLYFSMGDYPRAEPLYVQAMEIRKAVLGEQHPHYAGSLGTLALLYHSMGDYPRAEPLCREAVEITLGNLEGTADVQSQRQQVAMGESLRYVLDYYLSLATNEPKFQPAAYAALLRWKGSVWQRQQQQRLLIDQPVLKPRFDTLQSVASRLSALILNPPDPKQLEAWHRQLDELTDEREKLERDLSLASVAFRESKIPVTPEQLRDSLPDGTLLVDFLEYTHFTPANKDQQTKESRERRLLVHLVRAGEDVRAIDLGDVALLNVLVQTWRQDLETGQSSAGVDAARQLRQLIWEPLEEHLTGITTVYVSPDGLLGQFPIAALPGKQPGSYLLEELSIVMLPFPQGLPAMASTAASPNESTDARFCLVGGVDYEQVTASEASTTPATPAGPLLLAARGGQWQAFSALPGTVAEIDTIESLIRTHVHGATEQTILRGGLASEAAFTQAAPGSRYLHVATHGFFAPETVQNAMTASTPSPDRMIGDSQSRAPKLVGQHPDLLSGLVFAGANHQPETGADDGILTAAEVQSLDLRGVELAVLSACETGLGETAGGEGIIGLQRAFQLAGARTTITSLWKVDDEATQLLMVEFYRNLFERKLSKLESLRQAQIWLLNNPDAIKGRDLSTRGAPRLVKPTTSETKTASDKPTRSLPAYWAAFQLSGDPR